MLLFSMVSVSLGLSWSQPQNLLYFRPPIMSLEDRKTTRCHSETEASCCLQASCIANLLQLLKVENGIPKYECKDIVGKDTFYSIQIQIFSCIYANQSTWPKKCSRERPRLLHLPCKRMEPAEPEPHRANTDWWCHCSNCPSNQQTRNNSAMKVSVGSFRHVLLDTVAMIMWMYALLHVYLDRQMFCWIPSLGSQR